MDDSQLDDVPVVSDSKRGAGYQPFIYMLLVIGLPLALYVPLKYSSSLTTMQTSAVWFCLLLASIFAGQRWILRNPSDKDIGWIVLSMTTSVPIAVLVTDGTYAEDLLPTFVLQETLAICIGTIVLFFSRLIPSFNQIDAASKLIENNSKQTDKQSRILTELIETDLRPSIHSVQGITRELNLTTSVYDMKQGTKKHLAHMGIDTELDDFVPPALHSADRLMFEQREKVGKAVDNITEGFAGDAQDAALRAVSMLSLFASYYEFEGLTFNSDSTKGMVRLSTKYEHYAEAVRRMMINIAVLNKQAEALSADHRYEFHLFTHRPPHTWLLQTGPCPFKESERDQRIVTAPENQLIRSELPAAGPHWLQFVETLLRDDELAQYCKMYFASVAEKPSSSMSWPMQRDEQDIAMDNTYFVCETATDKRAPVIFHAKNLSEIDEAAIYAKERNRKLGTVLQKLTSIDQFNATYAIGELYQTIRQKVETQYGLDPNQAVTSFRQLSPKYAAVRIEGIEDAELEFDFTPNGATEASQYCLRSVRSILESSAATSYVVPFVDQNEFKDKDLFGRLPDVLFAVAEVKYKAPSGGASDPVAPDTSLAPETEKKWKIVMGAEGRSTGQSAVNLVYSTSSRGEFGKSNLNDEKFNDWHTVMNTLDNIFDRGEEIKSDSSSSKQGEEETA